MTYQTKQQVAFFAAVSAFTAVIENWITLPVPFFRLGLSNIPIMLALHYFGFAEVLFIGVFKVVTACLFRGTFLSVPFFVGLAGSVTYIVVCYPFWRIFRSRISFISVSVLAALAHNAAQLLTARVFLPQNTVLMIGAFLLPLGFCSGILTGIITNKVYNRYLCGGLPEIGVKRKKT